MLNAALTRIGEKAVMNPVHRVDSYAEGLRLSAGGRHADAIGCFEKALAAQPNDARVLFALGNTARALGMGAAAEEFFRRVLTLEPARIEATVNLAKSVARDRPARRCGSRSHARAFARVRFGGTLADAWLPASRTRRCDDGGRPLPAGACMQRILCAARTGQSCRSSGRPRRSGREAARAL